MAEVVLFVEDDAQERFLSVLVARLAGECKIAIRLRVSSAVGGWPKVLRELARFAEACRDGRASLPDLVVVAIDANCQGAASRRALIDKRAGDFLSDRMVSAVPDPHIERWYLLDGKAFKDVVGRGCDAPDQKCEKNRYKELLANAIREAGVEPLLGGIEYAEDLARAIDLYRAATNDHEFKRFVDDTTRKLRQLAGEGVGAS